MLRRFFVAMILIGLFSSPAFAQRVEVSGMFGYTASEGISFTGAPINGAVYNRVDPAASLSYGASFGAFLTEQAEVEFLWNRQSTTLEITGGGPMLSGDMAVDNYHVNGVFNFGDHQTMARPFFYFGVGATSYGDATFPSGRTLPGLTKFSWSFGGGVKVFPSPHAGLKFMARWTPTYIRSDAGGWWCDPFYGCGGIASPNYSNQFELSAGFVARF